MGILSDTYKKYEDRKEPQKALVPFFDDFYVTPDTPADPTDCDRYPDSPWCGENPIDKTPLSLGYDIVQDECNFGVQLNSTLLFIKLPPLQIVYRNPNCPVREPDKPQTEEDYEKDIEIPEGQNYYFLYGSYNSVKVRQNFPDGRVGTYESQISRNMTNMIQNGNAWSLDLIVTASGSANGVFINNRSRPIPPLDDNEIVSFDQTDTFDFAGSNERQLYSDGTTYSETTIANVHSFFYFQNREILERYLASAKRNGYPIVASRKTVTDPISGGYRTEEEIPVIYGMPINTIEPPPPKKFKKMTCCPQNDQLLRLILKRIGNLPARVPDLFTKQQPSMITIESLAELMMWQMQQLDALIGSFPIEIEIEDSDLVKEGNQKQKIKLPNQAEAIAELVGLALTIKRDTHATLITAIKAMGEAGMSKSVATKTLDVALANAEFLGYKLEQKKKQIPSLFTPGGKNITETLKEKNVEIITYENTDKKDLQDDLKTLLTMAARWNAQNWRRVGENAALSLYDNLIGNVDITKNSDNTDKQQDFNDFTEEAERGFINVTGITDTTDPWGRPYKERPKVREIGTDKGRYNDKNDGSSA